MGNRRAQAEAVFLPRHLRRVYGVGFRLVDFGIRIGIRVGIVWQQAQQVFEFADDIVMDEFFEDLPASHGVFVIFASSFERLFALPQLLLEVCECLTFCFDVPYRPSSHGTGDAGADQQGE